MGEQQQAPEQETILATFWQNAQQAQREGEESKARAWLEGIVELDQDNVDAWLALARLIPDARERMLCYIHVLELSPGHPEAKAGLRKSRRQL
jgi:uncharacterized protein HemY